MKEYTYMMIFFLIFLTIVGWYSITHHFVRNEMKNIATLRTSEGILVYCPFGEYLLPDTISKLKNKKQKERYFKAIYVLGELAHEIEEDIENICPKSNSV